MRFSKGMGQTVCSRVRELVVRSLILKDALPFMMIETGPLPPRPNRTNPDHPPGGSVLRIGPLVQTRGGAEQTSMDSGRGTQRTVMLWMVMLEGAKTPNHFPCKLQAISVIRRE